MESAGKKYPVMMVRMVPMACQISQEFHHFWMVKILEQDLFVVFERQFLCSLYPHIYCLSQVFVGRKMLQFVSLLFLEKKKCCFSAS
jgi:hypothetical protein